MAARPDARPDARPGADARAPARAALRGPDEVMRLERMGAFFPTRLSFMRRLLRVLRASRARIERTLWRLDGEGYGQAVYSVDVDGRRYSLCCCSRALDPAKRTDRVIADAWDASFVLTEGRLDEGELERIAASAPRQEAGRFEPRDLVLSRANKSVRAFEHVVERLACGRQPDPELIGSVGYLMRTTAVYGNGKFGIADRARVAGDTLLRAPFQAEMLAVYLIREFTLDLVEHVAASRGGERAARLAPALRHHLGVGNSTGLGMAPFLVSHPVLLNAWMTARETALARVRAVRRAEPDARERFAELLARARAHVGEWRVDDAAQSARIAVLARELGELQATATASWLAEPSPWERLHDAASACSLETQECVVAMLIELYPALVDDLAEQMDTSEPSRLDPAMRVAELRAVTAQVFGWAADIDLRAPCAEQRFWYVSEEKLEPRLGERAAEPGADRELPLAIARDAQALLGALDDADPGESVAEFLLAHPELRHIVRRAQTAAHRPYAEIRDNLLDGGLRPIDMLRCKLSFFGASRFDPRSDRWTRVNLFHGAPTREALHGRDADDWCFPALTHPPAS